jgi:hypothetical protein
VVKSRSGGTWRTAIVPGRTSRFDLGAEVDEVAVSAVVRDGREGAVTRLESTAP